MPCQPTLGVFVLALGAMAIAARMIEILCLPAIGADIDVTAQSTCAAVLNGTHRPLVTGQHLRAKLGAIGRAVGAKDVSRVQALYITALPDEQAVTPANKMQ